MTDRARELLERAVEWIEAQQEPRMIGANDIMKEICAYLEQPEVKREALSIEEIDQELLKNDYYSRSFTAGVRFAEKHHGIGGGDENPDA